MTRRQLFGFGLCSSVNEKKKKEFVTITFRGVITCAVCKSAMWCEEDDTFENYSCCNSKCPQYELVVNTSPSRHSAVCSVIGRSTRLTK